MIVCNTMTQGQLLRIESSYKKCDSVVLLSLSLRMSSENPIIWCVFFAWASMGLVKLLICDECDVKVIFLAVWMTFHGTNKYLSTYKMFIFHRNAKPMAIGYTLLFSAMSKSQNNEKIMLCSLDFVIRLKTCCWHVYTSMTIFNLFQSVLNALRLLQSLPGAKLKRRDNFVQLLNFWSKSAWIHLS